VQSYFLCHTRKGSIEAFLLHVGYQAPGRPAPLVQFRQRLVEDTAASPTPELVAIDDQANARIVNRQVHKQVLADTAEVEIYIRTMGAGRQGEWRGDDESPIVLVLMVFED
jgi:hypothetical protein